jgi:hypothetical protein
MLATYNKHFFLTMSKASKGPSGKHHRKLLKETFGLGKPTWTQKDVPDQTGKVVIVTGGSSGLGKATVKVCNGQSRSLESFF